MKYSWSIFTLICTALIGLALLPAHVVAQESAVVPPVGGPGSEFAFFATGFDDGEQVGFWVNAPNGTVIGNDSNQVFANGDGRADWTWEAPDNAMSGNYQMVSRGVDSKVERTIRFEISSDLPTTGAPGVPANGAAGVQPAVGTQGTEFAFFATGFDDDFVGYWLNTPDGSVISSEDYTALVNDGRADWTWRAPAGAMPGTYQMVARGAFSNVEQVIPFEIR